MYSRTVLVGHGDLPAAMASAAAMIGADVSDVEILCLEPGENLAAFADRLREALDTSTPTVILSDLAGGTPDNAARVISRGRPGTKVVSNMTLGLVVAVLLEEIGPVAEDLAEQCGLSAPTLGPPQR